MEDLNEGFAPPGTFWVLGVAAAVMVSAFVWLVPHEAQRPTPPRTYLSCYRTDGAPSILLDGMQLHVEQHPPLAVDYQLKYVKGWAISPSKQLQFVRSQQGSITLSMGADPVTYLVLSREGEVASQVPEFDLIDRATLTALHYRLAGETCDPLTG